MASDPAGGAGHHVAVMPASTGKTPPVTPLAASLHSQATRAATSSGSTSNPFSRRFGGGFSATPGSGSSAPNTRSHGS